MAKKARPKLDKKTPKNKSAQSKTTTAPKEDVVEMEAVAESEAGGIVDKLEQNRFILISVAVVLFGLLCLYLVGKQLGKDRHMKAGQAYTMAAAKKSIPDLDQVIADYKGSVAAGNSLITKAGIQLDSGKAKDAEETLQVVIDDYSHHPRYPQAYFMLGNLYQDQGDSEKAATNYKKVVELQEDGELTPIAWIRLGDLEFAKGNKDQARQFYEKVISQKLSGNPFFATAEERIDEIDLTMPTVVKNPTPPPAPPAPVPAPGTATPPPAGTTPPATGGSE